MTLIAVSNASVRIRLTNFLNPMKGKEIGIMPNDLAPERTAMSRYMPITDTPDEPLGSVMPILIQCVGRARSAARNPLWGAAAAPVCSAPVPRIGQMSESLTKSVPQLEPMTTGVNEVCDLTGLHHRMVRRLRADGTLRSVRIGGRRLVFLDSLRSLLNGPES